jgi:hypothetical protein
MCIDLSARDYGCLLNWEDNAQTETYVNETDDNERSL